MEANFFGLGTVVITGILEVMETGTEGFTEEGSKKLYWLQLNMVVKHET